MELGAPCAAPAVGWGWGGLALCWAIFWFLVLFISWADLHKLSCVCHFIHRVFSFSEQIT